MSHRVAIIYWPTSSVGGIATRSKQIRDEIRRMGHHADILVSPNQVSKFQEIYPEPQWIRGGDTRIWVDGHVSHHPDRVDSSISWLEENYDGIFFTYLCPHPIKAYPDPVFMPLYLYPKLPKVAAISDAYWDSYAEWGRECLKHVKATFVVNDAYAKPLLAAGHKVISSRQPFSDVLGPDGHGLRSETPLLTYGCQWKAIKGIKGILQAIPHLPKDIAVNMYSCGIDYYQLRYDPVWREAVNKDYFLNFNGRGRANYYGNVQHDVMMNELCKTWWTVNLQGHAAKNAAYLNGGYNNTEVEALYYGALPICHRNLEKSAIPSDLYVSVEDWTEIPDVVDKTRELALDPARQQAAREWVMKEHSAGKIVGQIMEAIYG